MRPACLAKIELPQQKESHNTTHQQGSIAALFFCVLMKKDSFTKNCPSTILLKGRNEKNDANVLSIVASILYQICIKKSIQF